MASRFAALLAAAALGWGSPTLAAQQPTTVIIVRHAERASETDRDPVLSDAGVRRAQALAAVLKDAPPTAIVVTQYQRTRLTAHPTAYDNAISEITVPTEPDVSQHAAQVATAVKRQGAGQVVLVVGHSDSVGEIIRALGGPPVQRLCTGSYDDLFVMILAGSEAPRLVHSRYGAPATDASCLDGAK